MIRNFDLLPSPRRGFASATGFAHAVFYLRQVLDCGGRQAIDYERIVEDVRPDTWCARAEHPLLYEIGELQLARRILSRLRACVGVRNYRVWGAHRLDGWSMARIADHTGVSKTRIHEIVHRADAQVEILLDRARRLHPRDTYVDAA